jgi:hypothetical protein
MTGIDHVKSYELLYRTFNRCQGFAGALLVIQCTSV